MNINSFSVRLKKKKIRKKERINESKKKKKYEGERIVDVRDVKGGKVDRYFLHFYLG